MIATSQTSEGFTAQVVLSNGDIAGEGYGPSAETATFFAVCDALRSTDERFATAGRGHFVFVDERGQRSINTTRERNGLAPL